MAALAWSDLDCRLADMTDQANAAMFARVPQFVGGGPELRNPCQHGGVGLVRHICQSAVEVGFVESRVGLLGASTGGGQRGDGEDSTMALHNPCLALLAAGVTGAFTHRPCAQITCVPRRMMR